MGCMLIMYWFFLNIVSVALNVCHVLFFRIFCYISLFDFLNDEFNLGS